MNPILLLAERIRSLTQFRSKSEVQEEFGDERPEDLAGAIQRVEPEEAADLLMQLEPLHAATILTEAPTSTAKAVIKHMPDEVIALYLDVLPMDDAVDLREELGEDKFDDLLEVIPDEDAREIRRLLAYPEDSVGRLMTEMFFEVSPSTTMAEVLEDLRKASSSKYESINDIYVLSPNRVLLGVFSLRKALRVEPSTEAGEIMNDDLVTAEGEESAEEAARRMARYGFYALPVLNSQGQMVGLFTGDDAQEVLRDAETQDVLALGAVSGRVESYLSLSIWDLVKRRTPWLLGLFVAETMTGMVMRHYGQQMDDLALSPLTYFIPLLIGAGGNSGSQVTTTITRALALEEITFGDWWVVMRREVVTALLVGLLLGLAGFARARFGWNTPLDLSLTIMFALPAIILWAGTIGSMLPLAAKKLKIDPAVMSAPFITTFVDATGLIIYFEIAHRMLRVV
ncbi:MAG: magnesium transporter [Fimbriimonadaceae bacterium]|jgi:magnesium transporter|nr:magnesium transporter [Fimbriimonadaceae bacterium]